MIHLELIYRLGPVVSINHQKKKKKNRLACSDKGMRSEYSWGFTDFHRVGFRRSKSDILDAVSINTKNERATRGTFPRGCFSDLNKVHMLIFVKAN